MTVTQAAARLGIQRDAVLMAIARGTIKAQRLGSIWVIEDFEVERYADENAGRKGRKPKQNPD